MGATTLPENEATTSRSDAAVYSIAVLTGAALVFQIQPIAGKFVLPLFGGGAAVWTTCMFFFQAMLLAGYAYAHWLTTTLTPGNQAALHGALLLLSAMLLPVGFPVDGPEPGAGDPNVLIWLALLSTIGFPFVMLSATAPLMQRWASITRPARSPYGLYALSNAGALLALLTYPVLVEPNLSLEGQGFAWSGGYLLFLVASLAGCRLLWRRNETAAPPSAAMHDTGPSRPWTAMDAILTVILSACGVVMLLAVTNQITANVAPIPFLWIAPLIVYLLTFVICYGSARWYDRPVWGALFAVSVCLLTMLEFFSVSASIWMVISAYLLVLMCACMVCHGELYKLRSSPENLARYYLLIAVGGALGGAFVSVIAPTVFDRYWEAMIGAYLIYLVFGVGIFRDARRKRRDQDRVRKGTRQARFDWWAMRLFAVGWTVGVFSYPAIVLLVASYLPRYDIVSSRNFYGVLKVRDVTDADPPQRRLVDGTTIHGIQSLESTRRSVPLSYYGRRSGIGWVLERLAGADARLEIGVVGLGVGTLAAYGRHGDVFRFYELNPAVIDLARERFSFLGDSRAAIEVVTGDGRISLERELREEGGRSYDLLVIDAFTSDAIPVHLLTKEALEVYGAHLRPGGVLAVHVTNSYLDLVPVVGDVAAALGRHAVNLQSVASDDGTFNADWVIVTEHPDFGPEETPEWLTAMRLPARPAERVWTDDYSDLLGTIRR